MLKLSGGKMDNPFDDELNPHAEDTQLLEEVLKSAKSWKEKIAPYIIDPMNSYKLAWDIVIGLIYLLAYAIDPYVLAFHAMEDDSLRQFGNIVSGVIFADILSTPFVG